PPASPPPSRPPLHEPRGSSRRAAGSETEVVGEPLEIVLLVDVVGFFGERDPKAPFARAGEQRIERALSAKPPSVEELAVHGPDADKVVASVDRRADDDVGAVKAPKRVLDRRRFEMWAVASESDDAPVSPAAKDPECRGETGGETLASLRGDLDPQEPARDVIRVGRRTNDGENVGPN